MRIAFVMCLLSRKAGGPFHSVRALAKSLKRIPGVEICVFGGIDADFEEDQKEWEGVRVRGLRVSGWRGFGYIPQLKAELIAFSPDLIHTHGLWTYTSKAVIDVGDALKIPRIVSPRGSLDPWALNVSKAKKFLALHGYEGSHLKNATVIHALSKSETTSIRSFGLSNAVAEIPNGITIDQTREQNREGLHSQLFASKNVLLFLGRIHPKKGVINLVRAVGFLKREQCAGLEKWHVLISGWDEVGHLKEVQAEVQSLQLEDYITISGPTFGVDKDVLLSKVKGFILPSYSEGLPMAVLEAWSWALPTLITEECNLSLAFECDAAIKIEKEPIELAKSLEAFFRMSAESRLKIGENAKMLARKSFEWEEIARQMYSVYNWMLNRAISKPEFVFLH